MEIVVLSVEDDDAVFLILKFAFQECGYPVKLYRAVDGDEALSMLHRSGPHTEVPRPRLILLNLNLPKKRPGGIGRLTVESSIIIDSDLCFYFLLVGFRTGQVFGVRSQGLHQQAPGLLSCGPRRSIRLCPSDGRLKATAVTPCRR
jgi:hypothetical protein